MSKRGRPVCGPGRPARKWKETTNRDARNKRHSRAYKAMGKVFGEDSDGLSDAKWNREFDKLLEAKRHPRFKGYLNRKRKPR